MGSGRLIPASSEPQVRQFRQELLQVAGQKTKAWGWLISSDIAQSLENTTPAGKSKA
jgi:hypothetical protein